MACPQRRRTSALGPPALFQLRSPAVIKFGMSLDVSIKRLAPDSAVVALTGALTLGTQLKIADTQMQELISGGIVKLVLDLTAVPYSDSAGLGTLLHLYGLLQQSQGSLRLCCVSERVAAMIRMTKTDTLLPIDLTLDDSVAAIG